MRRNTSGILLLVLILALMALLVLAARAQRAAAARVIAEASRCGARTQRGTPCRNPTKGGPCWRHRPLVEPRAVGLPI